MHAQRVTSRTVAGMLPYAQAQSCVHSSGRMSICPGPVALLSQMHPCSMPDMLDVAFVARFQVLQDGGAPAARPGPDLMHMHADVRMY